MASLDSAQGQLTTLRNISQSLTEENHKIFCYCQSQMLNLAFLSEALLLLPWGKWWCFGRTLVLCHSKCSLMLPEPQYRVLKCVGLVLQDRLESRVKISIIGTFCVCVYFIICYRWEANTYSASKYVVTIMDEDPAHSPARHQPTLGQTTTG